MEQIFADTSFFYALADRSDAHHERAKRFLVGNRSPLITSNFVFDELVTIARYDFGLEIAESVGSSILSSKICALLRIEREDEVSAWEIFRRFRDQDFSFTDCTSFSLMQRLGIEQAATIDRHFSTMGFVAALDLESS